MISDEEMDYWYNLQVHSFLWRGTSVAVLSDGRIMSGSNDGTVRIWNGASGECERVLEGHSKVSDI